MLQLKVEVQLFKAHFIVVGNEPEIKDVLLDVDVFQRNQLSLGVTWIGVYLIKVWDFPVQELWNIEFLVESNFDIAISRKWLDLYDNVIGFFSEVLHFKGTGCFFKQLVHLCFIDLASERIEWSFNHFSINFWWANWWWFFRTSIGFVFSSWVIRCWGLRSCNQIWRWT